MDVTPELSATEAKCALAAKMREHFKEHNVVRYAHAAEAWMVQDEAWQGPIAEHPRRQELVSLNADDGCECWSHSRHRLGGGAASPTREAVRDRAGRAAAGAAHGLAQRRHPADLRPGRRRGTGFITNVPGAPFQIIGRRGPTGELFVGQVGSGADLPRGTIEQMNREFEAKTGIEVEIVTGPEAERLIRDMQRRIVKHLSSGRATRTKHDRRPHPAHPTEPLRRLRFERRRRAARRRGRVERQRPQFPLARGLRAGLPRRIAGGERVSNPTRPIVRLLGKPGGNTQRATFVGAPDGGVPVHEGCAVAWFQKMDAEGWEGNDG